MSEWTETKAVLAEVEQLFSRDDDLRDVREVRALGEQLRSLYTGRVSDARDTIRKLTREIEGKQRLAAPPSAAEHTEKLRKLINDNTDQLAVEEAIRNLDAKRESLSRMQSMGSHLRERTVALAGDSSISDSRLAHTLSLYTQITHITWDFATQTPEKLTGFVGHDASKEFRPFALDTQNKTPFDLTQELWGVIGAALEEE